MPGRSTVHDVSLPARSALRARPLRQFRAGLAHVPPDELSDHSRAVGLSGLAELVPQGLVDADGLPRRAPAAPRRHIGDGVMTVVARTACLCHDTQDSIVS